MTHMLAQITDPSRLVEYGIGISAFGLIVWLVHHVTSKTIPGLIGAFKETNEKQLEAFERVNKEQRVEFREILEKDRELHHAREEAQRKEFRDAIEKAATVCKAGSKQ